MKKKRFFFPSVDQSLMHEHALACVTFGYALMQSLKDKKKLQSFKFSSNQIAAHMHARGYMIFFSDRSQNDICNVILTIYIQSFLTMRPKLYTLEFITDIVSSNQSQVHVHARAFMLIILKATSKLIYTSSLKEKYSHACMCFHENMTVEQCF